MRGSWCSGHFSSGVRKSGGRNSGDEVDGPIPGLADNKWESTWARQHELELSERSQLRRGSRELSETMAVKDAVDSGDGRSDLDDLHGSVAGETNRDVDFEHMKEQPSPRLSADGYGTVEGLGQRGGHGLIATEKRKLHGRRKHR